MATKVEQVLDAIAKLESQKQEAIEELLADRKKIDQQLAQLGYSNGKSPAKKGFSKPKKDRYCPYCEMNGHDRREHRGQAKKKKFTTDELKRLGL